MNSAGYYCSGFIGIDGFSKITLGNELPSLKIEIMNGKGLAAEILLLNRTKALSDRFRQAELIVSSLKIV